MKRFTLLSIAAIMAVFASCLFTACSDDQSKDGVKVKPTETFVFYVDLEQLGTKSAIDEVITDGNRSLIATVLTADSYNSEWTEYAKTLLKNLSASGLDTSVPVYGYVNMTDEGVEFATIASVSSADKLDKFMEFFSDITGEDIEVYRNGDTREFMIEEFAFAYNNKRFVMVANDSEAFSYDPSSFANKALNRPEADLSAYAKYDVAFDVDIPKCIDIAIYEIQGDIDDDYEYLEYYADEWEYDWVMDSIKEQEQMLEYLKDFKGQYSDDARIVQGTTFLAGKIVAELSMTGYNGDIDICKKVSNKHLQYVDNDVLAAMNIGINGKNLSTILSENINSEYANILGFDRNEFNIYFGILCDAIKSINGDMTLALNDVEFDYYDDPESVDALLAVDVNDDYIISNIAQFGEGILTKYDNNRYGYTYDDFVFSLGQQNNTLFATVNNQFKPMANSASTKSWAKELANSYGYFVVDIDNIIANRNIAPIYRSALDEMNRTSANNVNKFVESFSYAYVTINTPTSVQMVVAFDDKKTNSLEQVVKQVVPIIMSEVTSELF